MEKRKGRKGIKKEEIIRRKIKKERIMEKAIRREKAKRRRKKAKTSS